MTILFSGCFFVFHFNRLCTSNSRGGEISITSQYHTGDKSVRSSRFYNFAKSVYVLKLPYDGINLSKPSAYCLYDRVLY